MQRSVTETPAHRTERATQENRTFLKKDLSTGWTVGGSNSGGGDIFRTGPDRPWGPPSLLYNGYRFFFPGVKRPGRDVDHTSPYRADVKERVEP